MSASAIIVAGGVGDRFGRLGGKQLAPLAGRSVLAHTLAAFELAESIDEVIVVVHPDRVAEFAMEMYGFDKITGVVAGGQTRQASVNAGLEVVAPAADVIVVHDGARPMVTPDMIDSALRTLVETEADGVVVGHPSYDTIKQVAADGTVVATEDRSQLWVAQTPQVFRANPLRAAYASARDDGFLGTDDSSLVERLGGRVVMALGPRDNIKVTVPEDIVVAETVLEARARQL